MGRRQRGPLHIHPTHGELTAIVGGTEEVSQVAPSDGQLARTTATFTPGDLIYSEPFCGHEWVNTSSGQLLGNVVFATPAFSGNLYVTEHDARKMNSGAPTSFRVED